MEGAAHALFVKLPVESGPKFSVRVDRLRREFEMTKRVKAACPETRELKIVSPAGFLEEIGGLVTWEIDGDSLQDTISTKIRFQFGAPAPGMLRLCELAGRWLRRFHCLRLLEDQPDLREILTVYCGDRLETLVAIKGSKVTRNLANSLKKKISGWIDEALAASDAKIILCHNDYSPHNIIVRDEAICVLDFSFAGPGFPVFDVACFWHKLEDIKISPLYGGAAIEALQEGFLGAYGQDFDRNRPESKLGVARLVLSKMVTLLNERSLRMDHWIDKKRRYAAYLALVQSDFECFRT